MTDHYAELGELHDLFMPDVWDPLVGTLATTFGNLGPDATILDLGAGSGVGTLRLGHATRAQILAVEPSLTMRSVLLARIADDPELSERVSVHAGAAPAILDQIDGPLDGFVCAHMLGHLSTDQRRDTFERLAALLRPDGIGLITVPRQDTAGTEAMIEERRIGRHRYVAHHLPGNEDGGLVSEYSVFDGDRLIRSASFTSTWAMPSQDELRTELRAAGLILDPTSGGLTAVWVAPHTIPTLADIKDALTLVPRNEVIARATSARQIGPAAADAARSATYSTRLALHALACAEPLRASAARAGVVGGRVLDLACGPAMVSRVLLATGARRVDGADADPAMIAAARALPMTAGLTVRVADATEPLPFADAAFDVVWVGDFWRPEVLPEIRRVLRADGRLVLRATAGLDWLPDDLPEDFTARVHTGADPGIDRWAASRGGPVFTAPPTDLPGWAVRDHWEETVELHSPIPEVAEEYLLQDFACFHGNLAAPELSEPDWQRLCALVDPASAERVLARPGGRLAWRFNYRVLSQTEDATTAG
ncbi:class I SAM-dependent methyltransferase [Micropruina sp.]|uniref:class I SAM-dependent methyltransferase n=1 Tax=Micropruina sp. TaxID=2737536 RepID=UPI0039E5883D